MQSILENKTKLDADPIAIQQIEIYGMLDTKFQVCTIVEKTKETVLESYKGTAKVLWIIKMVEYNKVNVTLSDRQLNKPKSSIKNQTEVTLKINTKCFWTKKHLKTRRICFLLPYDFNKMTV